MLWFLHLCSDAGVVILEYTDSANGTMLESEDGNGRFKEVVLHPHVVVKESWMMEKVNELHDKAHHFCFISNSCNFPVLHDGVCDSIGQDV
jgi:organic hydroperoxide reductase OsmC/OhrA